MLGATQKSRAVEQSVKKEQRTNVIRVLLADLLTTEFAARNSWIARGRTKNGG
jgi:hypothetical protein